MSKQTPLYAEHVALGAKMTEFAGWEMPVSYAAGPIAEHQRVREALGLFDLSHMGQVAVSGPDALAFLQHIATANIARIRTGDAGYAPLCYSDGGMVDDTFIYHLEDRYLVVVNAANTDKDLRWFDYQRAGFHVAVEDLSERTCMLALQGPRAQQALQPLTPLPLDDLGYHKVTESRIAGAEAVIGRTGYTGEDGFELYLSADDAVPVWQALLAAGEPLGLLPIGLAARDSLRFEPCMPLYGHELGPAINPLEAGLLWAVALKKGPFVGRDALLKERVEGSARRLVGFEMTERSVPRHGMPVEIDGAVCGHVTSGLFAPTLSKFLGMAFVPAAQAAPGTEIAIVIRGRARAARIVKRPFYTPTYRS
jgi:aminomethyltransferase